MKSVEYWRNSDGTWSARIFAQTETFPTMAEAIDWLRANGESV